MKYDIEYFMWKFALSLIESQRASLYSGSGAALVRRRTCVASAHARRPHVRKCISRSRIVLSIEVKLDRGRECKVY